MSNFTPTHTIMSGIATRTFADSDVFDRVLQNLNDAGVHPVLAGVDAIGQPFLAAGWGPGGDGWGVDVLVDTPNESTVGYDFDCHEPCGCVTRIATLTDLSWPVTVILADDVS